jgi:hypothetical protein
MLREVHNSDVQELVGTKEPVGANDTLRLYATFGKDGRIVFIDYQGVA